MDKKAYFRVNGVGEVRSDLASLVLERVGDAYAGLCFLNDLKHVDWVNENHYFDSLRFDIDHSVWVDPRVSANAIDLQLSRVKLSSPGFWEFIGKLNPLEVMRAYLSDRHERKKDISYRNSIEKERLMIENDLLRMRSINEAVMLAQAAGLNDIEISSLVRDNALIPMMKLESLQDMGLISDTDLEPINRPKKSEDERNTVPS